MERLPHPLPPQDQKLLRLTSSAYQNMLGVDEELGVNKSLGNDRSHALSLYREKGYNAHLILLARSAVRIPVGVQLNLYPGEIIGPFAENNILFYPLEQPPGNTPNSRISVSLISQAAGTDSLSILRLIGQPDSTSEDSASTMAKRTYEEIRSIQRFIKSLEGQNKELEKLLEEERTRLIYRILSDRERLSSEASPLRIEKIKVKPGHSFTKIWIDHSKYIPVDNKRGIVRMIEQTGGYDAEVDSKGAR
jgi:hypothetical protein